MGHHPVAGAAQATTSAGISPAIWFLIVVVAIIVLYIMFLRKKK